jgi:DNA-binding NtrC family response regulator
MSSVTNAALCLLIVDDNEKSLELLSSALAQPGLETTSGNQSQAARILRIGRDALRYKLKKHNLDTSAASHRSENSE